MSNDYENEASSRDGTTDVYCEHEQKTKNYNRSKPNDGLMVIFFEFYTCMNSGASVDSAEAQAFVAKLWVHITLIIDVISF